MASVCDYLLRVFMFNPSKALRPVVVECRGTTHAVTETLKPTPSKQATDDHPLPDTTELHEACLSFSGTRTTKLVTVAQATMRFDVTL